MYISIVLLFKESKYIKLNKTYRSSEEIINYSNKVLGLSHITAIRRDNHVPVIEVTEKDLYEDLLIK